MDPLINLKSIVHLTDKDYQLVSKTFRKVAELFYQNSNNQEYVQSLTCLIKMIPQIVSSKFTQGLTITSQMQILKAKVKGNSQLKKLLQVAIEHLKYPKFIPISTELIIEALSRMQLFVFGCTIALRSFTILKEDHQLDWKRIVDAIGSNIDESPHLAVQLSNQMCVNNEQNTKLITKSGIVMYMFVEYFNSNLKDLFNLYRGIKLIKLISQVDRSVIRERQKILAVLIFKENYFLIVSQICSKCYDVQYCSTISKRSIYDQGGIDFPYIWSHVESFCKNQLNQEIIHNYLKLLQTKLSGEMESKIFAICSNYCKYCKFVSKQLLKITPKYQQSLWNYLKMCFNMSEIDAVAPHYINWKELDELILVKSDRGVIQLANYLRNLMNQPARVGSLNSKFLQVFSMDKNTDMLLDRARRVPKTNDQLPNLRMILSEKSNNNEFDSDTLNMTKEKALQSLRKAVTNRVKLDLNSVVETIQTGDINQLTSFVQILEIYLTMFDGEEENLNKKKLFQLIAWIQDHYNGEIIDWGSIREVLRMICQQNEWKKHVKQLNQHCFWLLSIDKLENNDQNQIWRFVQTMSIQQLSKKLPFVLGFFGKIYFNVQRAACLQKKAKYLEMMVNNVAKNRDYNVNLMMISYFLRGWGQQEEDYDPKKYTKKFQEFIHPLVNIVTSHPRQTPQQNHFLQSCLPYKINTNKLSTDLETLIKNYGKLGSKVFEQLIKTGKKQTNVKLDSLNEGHAEQMHNSMIFASKFPSSINTNSVIKLVDFIKSNPNSYWQLFPRYVDIMANTIIVVGESQSEPIVEDLSKIAETLFEQINQNEDILDDERLELLEEMRDSFQNLKERKVYIEIERIKKVVTRIVETEVREQILVILNDYKIDESKKLQSKIKQPLTRNAQVDIKKQQEINNKKLEVIMTESKLVEQIPVKQESRMVKIERMAEENFEKKETQQQMLQSLILRNNIGLAEAFKTLKKIINRQIVPQIFNEIYPVFVENTLNQNQKELLGSQLVQFYNISNCQKALSLLIDCHKTRLTREQILELVSKYIPAFALKKREKLISKVYIDIAMQRVKQQFLADGCQVATYNLNQTDDLEYFYSKKYHKNVLQLINMVSLQDEIAQLLELIGKAARYPQIRSEWIEVSLHTKIMNFIIKFPKSMKIIPPLNFALSSLTFEENKACSQVIKNSNQMYLILQSILIEPSNQQVAQYASLFIFNLCFSRCFQSYPSFNISKVIYVLKKLFAANLKSDNLAPYSYILKSIGQLSINQKYCAEILEQQFCDNVNCFSEKVDILTGYDEKKAEYVKMMIDMIFSLSKNKQSLRILHKHKITLLAATLLEAIQTKYSELIGLCIDTINALCQDPLIQSWFVNEKRLPYILLDILKLQSEQQLVLKAMRMITNLTLKNTNIPYILKSNILGVIANIVIPHLGIYRVSSENLQFSKKVEAYIIKSITRIFEVKPELDQVLKSGFLDCIVRLIEMVEVEEKFLDIFFYYSPHIPNFLNKRAFSSLIKILIIKINDKNALVKCIQSFRNVLSFTYQGDEDNNPIEGLSEMYLKVFQTEFVADGLFLLGYHLFRSNKFRQQLKLPNDKVQPALALLSQQQIYKQFCSSITFLIHNPPVNLWLQDTDSQISGKEYDIMRKGIDCYLYRSDGSHKQAKIDIDEEYNFRVYKAPDGEIKKKYTSNVRYIREFQIEYQNHDELWNKSVFVLQKGIFHQAKPENCCTLVSNSKWGEINLINIQFYQQETKLIFYMCLSHILAIFRL